MSDPNDTLAALRRRRAAARRLPPLYGNCSDPWVCRCRDDPPSTVMLAANPWPVVRLSLALAALRRAWLHADVADRAVLAAIAAVLIVRAEPEEVAWATTLTAPTSTAS